jgi:hypothetical protein
MRFPSVDTLLRGAVGAARRFPLALVAGAVAAAAGWWVVGASGDREVQRQAERVLYVASLGLPAFIAAKMIVERHRLTGLRAAVPHLVAAVLLGIVYALRPDWGDPVAATRYVQISAGLHMLVAVGPYLGVGGENGFWQYNRTLLLRFLVGFVFAGVLFAGLSVALVAIDRLFGVEVAEETYGRLWFLTAFVFHPWFFLGGVPEDLEALEADRSYPAVLKVFGQYILAPIVAVYLLILTVYLCKVLVTRVWPSGWIGWLVSSVAAAGILSLLILYPVRERRENRWVATYARWFFVALLPSIAMLLMAAWKRIDQYGITERRYFLVVLALWLAGVSIYSILRRDVSIRAVPATLCALAFVTLLGPWGAYAVSERSQAGRLAALLAAHDLPAEPAGAAVEVPFEDRREISAAVRYLVETGRTSRLRAELGDRYPDEASVEAEDGRPEREALSEAVVTALGVEYVARRPMLRPEGEFDLRAAEGRSGLAVAGYDWIFRDRNRLPDTLALGDRALEVALDSARATLVVRERGEALIEVPLAGAIRRGLTWEGDMADRGWLPAEALRVDAENEQIRIAVLPTSVSGRLAQRPVASDAATPVEEGQPTAILSMRADYLVRLLP